MQRSRNYEDDTAEPHFHEDPKLYCHIFFYSQYLELCLLSTSSFTATLFLVCKTEAAAIFTACRKINYIVEYEAVTLFYSSDYS